jgi:hypothetical protein
MNDKATIEEYKDIIIDFKYLEKKDFLEQKISNSEVIL